MMNIIKEALQNPLFDLFLAITLGYAIAGISFKNMKIGTVGILVASIFMGMLGLKVPSEIKILGFLIFIYAVGLQSGPRVFSMFRKKNLPYLFIAFIIFTIMFVSSFGFAKIMGLSKELFAGIFCSLFGNASSLANLISLYDTKLSGFSFSIAYPVSLISNLLFVMFALRFFKIAEKPGLDGDFGKKVNIKDEKIVKEPILVKKEKVADGIRTVPKLEDDYGVVVTEIIRNEKPEIPSPNTRLEKGDIIITEGYETDVKKFRQEAGSKTGVPFNSGNGIRTRQILLTNREIDGKTIKELEIRKKYRCVITRIWRSGVFIAAPESNVELEQGDSIVATGPQSGLMELTKLLGKHDKAAGEIDFLSMGLVITLGLILGVINFVIPGLLSIKLGMVGGVLLISLIVGYSRRIGFISGQMSPSARAILRDLGITFFIISVGAEAGALFLKTEFSSISKLFFVSLIINLLYLAGLFIIILILRKREKAATVLAVFTGTSTCTPAMGLLVNETGNDEFMIPYASVYPLSQILVIIFSQIFYLLY